MHLGDILGQTCKKFFLPDRRLSCRIASTNGRLSYESSDIRYYLSMPLYMMNIPYHPLGRR